MIRSSLVTSAFVLVALAACGDSTPPPAAPTNNAATEPKAAAAPASTYNGHPKLGHFGVDTDGMDKTVKPGNDFYKYAGGTWMKNTQIPGDKTRWGMFDELRENADANVHTILDETSKKKNDKGTPAQKIGDYYATYLDSDTIEKKGFAPAKPGLDAIASAKTLNDIAKLMARPDLPLESPIGMGVSVDEKNPDKYIVECEQAGLGLPDRDFYTKTDDHFKDIRAKYETHIAKVLGFAQTKKDDKKAAADAKAIVALETKIADAHWPIADRRERDKTYNPKAVADLAKESPKFPWKLYMDTAGYGGESTIIVREVTAMPKLAEIFAATPVATWKAYLTYHYLRAESDVLPKALDEEVFDFVGKTLNGQPQQRDRWKRAVSSTNRSLGEAIGQLYVAKYFKPEAKAQMDTLVENLRKAYSVAHRFDADWMTAGDEEAGAGQARHPSARRSLIRPSGRTTRPSIFSRATPSVTIVARRSGATTSTRTSSASRRIATSGT